MSDLDKQLLKLYQMLEEVLNDIKEDIKEEKEDEPIIIPSEIYEDICNELGTDEINLMGIS
tara:strand:- start:743 stop:925 length:183 start_codon:yes stop_codon:yes gene_type:complete